MVVLKVSNIDRSKKIGIVAQSFEDFIGKVSRKFNIENELIRHCSFQLAKDGVLVDNDKYFQTLNPQTMVLVVLPDEKPFVKTDFELLMNNIREWSKEYLTAGKHVQSFIDDNSKLILSELLRNGIGSVDLPFLDSDTRECSIDEWFKGVFPIAHTKEKHMFRRAQDRIRSYFYKTKDDLTHSEEYRTNSFVRKEIDLLIETFKTRLKICAFFGYLFDRNKTEETEKLMTEKMKYDTSDRKTPRSVKMKLRIKNNSLKRFNKLSKNQTSKMMKLNHNLRIFPPPMKSLCNSFGDFDCQGQWDCTGCIYTSHVINPYLSKENRIIFQTWNLDHQIERSRTVVPSILKHADLMSRLQSTCVFHGDKPGIQLTCLIYFNELFTTYNLKLVHIVCHDKGAHELTSKGGALCEECIEREEELI